MQVACDNCGATYEFDPKAIPSEGYDAQCTHCKHIFFVSPQPKSKDQITVTCNKCNTIYRFAASDIPAGGYDAQCTQCQSIFFVSANPEQTATKVNLEATSDKESASGVSEVTQVTGPGIYSDIASAGIENNGRNTLMPSLVKEPQAEATVVTPPISPPSPPPLKSHKAQVSEPPEITKIEDPVGLSELSEPDETDFAILSSNELEMPDDNLDISEVTLEPEIEPEVDANTFNSESITPATGQDFTIDSSNAAIDPLSTSSSAVSSSSVQANQQLIISNGAIAPAIKKSKSKVWLILLLIILILGGGATFAVMYIPQVRKLTIDRFLAYHHTVAPYAVSATKQAWQLIMLDTESAYTKAQDELEKAYAIEPDYPLANAYAGLIHVFRGLNKRFTIEQLQVQFKRTETNISSASDLDSDIDTAEMQQVKREEIRHLFSKLEEQIKQLNNEADEELDAALTLLTDSVKNYPNSPELLLAAGFCYSSDFALMPKAEEMLKRSVELRLGSGAQFDISNPPDAMTAYIRGVIWSRQDEDRARVLNAYKAALKLEPNFQRVRFDLARELFHAGDTEQAAKLFKEIISSVPEHDRAISALAELEQALAPEPVPETLAPKVEKDTANSPVMKKGKNRQKRKGKKRNR